MVNAGWSHSELMAMRARDFGFWFDQQMERNKAEAEAIRAANKA